MQLKHRTPQEFDAVIAADRDRGDLRFIRLQPTPKSVAVAAESQRNRRLARIPIPSRTLGGI